MRTMRSRSVALSMGLLVGLAPFSAVAKLGDAARVTGAVQGEASLESPARQTSIDRVASGEDVVMGDAVSTHAQSCLQISGSINIFAAGTSIGTINGAFQLLDNPFEQGSDNLRETGAIITTPANDTISVDYSIGASQVDTAVVYIVNPTFGGSVTPNGSAPAPIVP
jgi:hypothetical protein